MRDSHESHVNARPDCGLRATIVPVMWIRTEENEKLLFRRYSTTHAWGFFSEHARQGGNEFKLPLAGLKPWCEP